MAGQTKQSFSTFQMPQSDTQASNIVKLREIVDLVLSAWTAYKLALQSESAGHLTAEKDVWFRDVLTEFLLRKKAALAPYDLVEWLEDLLNTEFDLIVEDGTTELTASLLLRLVSYLFDKNSCSGDQEKAMTQLEENLARLRNLASKQATNHVVSFTGATSESDESDDDGLLAE